jgi:SAM-dependent methyltransferase
LHISAVLILDAAHLIPGWQKLMPSQIHMGGATGTWRCTVETTFPKFIDPYTKHPLQIDKEGNLYAAQDGQHPVYSLVHGSYDFVRENNAEREHYEAEYQQGSIRSLGIDDIRGPWHDPCMPWYKVHMQSMGDLAGKKILVVGAGRSCKEFYFATCGANVIFTDLSLQGVLASSADYKAAQALLNNLSTAAEVGRRDREIGSIQFHAADANHLPFADESFDIVYGSAFVHHLDDWLPFLLEVNRVLKRGGTCRFYDQADSWLWTSLKRTVLRPLQVYSYWRHPRSEGDIRANKRGGFNRQNLLSLMRAAGFRKLYFRRQSFFLVIGLRHIGKSVNWNKRVMKAARPVFHCFRLLDVVTSWCHRISDNRLALIWGFEK